MLAVIDYGMGNLRSVQKAFELVGVPAEITSNPDEIRDASHVVLPGVGAFGDAMEALRRDDLIPAMERHIQAGKPFLGICLGMQLLFEGSDEGSSIKGLSWLPGWVRRIPAGRKVPHMGWNELTLTPSPLWQGIQGNSHVYFVHSYYVDTPDRELIAATTDYGFPFTAAVARGNIMATQFHPEKSGDVGLQILRNFGGMR